VDRPVVFQDIASQVRCQQSRASPADSKPSCVSLPSRLCAQVSADGGLAKWHASYGDWVPADPNAKVSNSLCAAYNYITNVRQAADLATGLGNSADAAMYTQLLASVQSAYTQQFVTNSSSMCADICGQTSYSFSYQAVCYRFAPYSPCIPVDCISALILVPVELIQYCSHCSC
jgi:hypothetical protein